MFHILYKKQKNSYRRKIFIFSLLSGFISAVAAIFLTPKTGKQMRDMAVDSAKEAKDKLEATRKNLDKQVKDVSGDVKDKAQDVSSKALQAGQKTLNVFSGLWDKAEDSAEENLEKADKKVKSTVDEAEDKVKKVKHEVDEPKSKKDEDKK